MIYFILSIVPTTLLFFYLYTNTTGVPKWVFGWLLTLYSFFTQILFTFIFLDAPRELTFSERLERYIDDPWLGDSLLDRWRRLVFRIAMRLIDWVDPEHVG